jgi:Spy/CpxP family protein refolding chaperone
MNMRSERRWINAALAAALLGSVIGLAGFGWSHRHGCHGEKFLQRMVDAHLEETLDDLKATPEQRAQINQLKTGLVADFQALHDGHQSLLTSLSQQFSSDRLDAATLDANSDSLLKAHDQLRLDLRNAVVRVHDLLTPEQRQQVAAKLQEHSARCSK